MLFTPKPFTFIYVRENSRKKWTLLHFYDHSNHLHAAHAGIVVDKYKPHYAQIMSIVVEPQDGKIDTQDAYNRFYHPPQGERITTIKG